MKLDAGPLVPRDKTPSIVLWAAVLVLLTTTAILLCGAWRIGIATDEPFHVLRLRNLFATGWYVLDDDLSGSEPGPWVTDAYVYAPVAALLMHGVCMALGVEGAAEVSTSATAYGVRHLVVASIGLLGTASVAVLGRMILRSWAWGFVAAATLMAIPMWPGLSMFDNKDVPAATGYTLVTLGAAMCLRTSRGSSRMAVVTVATLALGTFLAVGSRPGLWPGLAIAGLVVVIFSMVRDGEGRRRWATWRLTELAVAVVIAYILLMVAYPAMFARPDNWLLESVLDSGNYAHAGLGTWNYIPRKVLTLMPPGLLLLGCVGCAAAFLDWRGRTRTLHEARVGLVAAQALGLPALAMLHQSHLYDDLRQVLFALPAVALLLVLGTKHVVTDLGSASGVARKSALIVWSIALLVPTAVQVQLFPYSYAYVAPQVDVVGAKAEPDFWRTSFRELASRVRVDEFVMCSPVTTDRGFTMRFTSITGRPPAESGTNCLTDPISPLRPYLDRAPSRGPNVGSHFLALFERGREPGSNCETMASVARPAYWTRRIIGRLARCELVLTPYPEGQTVTMRPDGSGSEYLLGGWTSHADVPGVRLRERFGSLGFEVPTRWSGASVRLEICGTADDVPQIWVNNRSLAASAVPCGWDMEVPASAVRAMGEKRLVVTVERPPQGQLILTSLQARPLAE